MRTVRRISGARRRWVVGSIAVAIAVVALGCSSDESSAPTSDDGSGPSTDAGPSDPTEAPVPQPPSRDDVDVPEVEGPITSGKGTVVLAAPGFDLASVSYVEEEFFISGDATTYTSAEELTSDGEWNVEPAASAPYRTRIVVRRPMDPAAFGGTAVVEWLNVTSGLDAAPDWTYTHDQIIDSGSAWIGVSAQRVGIVGGGNPLGDALALKNADPERYAALEHPGDDHSYDIFSQAGAAVWFDHETILGGLEPAAVVAMGESQSAFRLTTYVDAVAPLAQAYNGYLIHSRGASGAPLAADADPPREAPDPTLIRTDLDQPVLILSAETDLAGDRLGYVRARQPDTDRIAGWEVAGTAHADAYNLGIGDTDDGSGVADVELFDAMRTPPSSVYFGVIECDSPINAGPHTYVARSALASLVAWVRSGIAPPTMPRLELDEGDDDFVRDEFGNAVGGIRTPQIDVPIATLSGLGQAGDSFCGLFGTTVPFDDERLAELYPDHDDFVLAWEASLERAVNSGAILGSDAGTLRQVAQASSIGRTPGG